MISILSVLLLVAQIGSEAERFDPVLRGAYIGARVAASPRGVKVREVERASPAERAGLRASDVIVAIDDRAVPDRAGLDAFLGRVRELGSGEATSLQLLRGGRTMVAKVAIGGAADRAAVELLRALRANRLLRDERKEALEGVLSSVASISRIDRRTNAYFEELNEAVGALGISHAAVFPDWSYQTFLAAEHDMGARYHTGFFFQRWSDGEGHRYFVRSVMTGSPAQRAGIRVGDEITAVSGVPVQRSSRRVLAGFESFHNRYAVAVDRDETVRIAVRSAVGDEPREVSVRADTALSGFEATRSSARLLETSRGPVGYVHFWNLLGRGVPRFLESLLWDEFANARALVVDLRGRGGSIDVLLAVEEQLVGDRRPVVVLVDEEARSAKEVLAYRLAKHEGVVVIGERTAGAVRPARYVSLGGAGHAMLPAGASKEAVAKLSDGLDLEGRGVEPDIEVEHRIPYSKGRDPILSRALVELERILALEPRRARL